MYAATLRSVYGFANKTSFGLLCANKGNHPTQAKAKALLQSAGRLDWPIAERASPYCLCRYRHVCPRSPTPGCRAQPGGGRELRFTHRAVMVRVGISVMPSSASAGPTLCCRPEELLVSRRVVSCRWARSLTGDARARCWLGRRRRWTAVWPARARLADVCPLTGAPAARPAVVPEPPRCARAAGHADDGPCQRRGHSAPAPTVAPSGDALTRDESTAAARRGDRDSRISRGDPGHAVCLMVLVAVWRIHISRAPSVRRREHELAVWVRATHNLVKDR